MEGAALSVRASTPGGTATARVASTAADAQVMTEETMKQICRQAFLRGSRRAERVYGLLLILDRREDW